MLTLEEKIGQMCVVGFEGLEPPPHILEWLASGRIGGVILFARNVASPQQLAELTQTCHAAAARPILIAIDQEGGIVARLADGFSQSPGAMALGAADSEELAEQVSAVLGAEMRALGINWNLAPALDMTHNIENPSVGVRSLGTDAGRIAALGVAQVRGFQRAGVAATAKHFPGKAKTPVDPHVSLPVIDEALDDLWEQDLVPFRAVSDAGIASMLITHVQFKALEPDYPSTMSPAIIDGLLREQVGFEGVVTTDCMEMGAITNTYGPGESAVLAALAGANVILFSHTRAYQEAAYDALLDAARSGRLPEAKIDFAVQKIQDMKAAYVVTAPPDLSVIRHPEHLAIMDNAARAGMVQIQAAPDMLPLRRDDSRTIGLVEFASHLDSGILEQGGQTGFGTRLHEQLPQVQQIAIMPKESSPEIIEQARALAQSVDVLIIATRNAHLIPPQRDLAQMLLDVGQQTVLLCLRNPYDAGVLSSADVVLCSLNDGAPSLRAAADALTGAFEINGSLPVPLVMEG